MNKRLLPADALRRILHNHKRCAFPVYADNYRTDGVTMQDLMDSLKALEPKTMDIKKLMADRREQQFKMGETAADAMYAAGSVPLAIVQAAKEARSHSPVYAAGMESAALRMEAKELGGLK